MSRMCSAIHVIRLICFAAGQLCSLTSKRASHLSYAGPWAGAEWSSVTSTMPPKYVSKYYTFSASTICQIAAGLAYCFSLYSDALKARFGYSQVRTGVPLGANKAI